MKFTKGYWMNRTGVSVANMGQVREVRVEGRQVYLFCVNYTEDRRSMDGPVIEMYISSPQPNVIRLKAFHFMGVRKKLPAFDLADAGITPEVTETEDTVVIQSGDTRLVVKKRPCSFTYYYKDKKLTAIGDRFGTTAISTVRVQDEDYMEKQMDLDLGGTKTDATKCKSFMRVQLEVAVDEKIYGLGERFTPFVKNGQTVNLWNEDGGTCSEIAYKNIPFYLSNRNYGVFVNDSGPVSYEICSEQVTRAQFSVPGECIDFMVIGGATRKDVLRTYTTLTGKPALPPAWTFGLWLSSSFMTNYDEETVTRFVRGMEERDIPLEVFHFDCFWMRENEWCNFTWDNAMFPDVEQQLARMKNNHGLKICVWINPYIGQKSPLFREGMENDYLLKRPNGDVWQWDLWQAGMAIVDFTNPEACRWYKSKLRKLLDQGVDCFKTDFGERIPLDVAFHDGSDPLRMHNYYTYLYNKCVFELLEEYKGKGEAVVFARSATVGGQKFPVHWGGDCSSNYVSMYESLRGGLSFCLSGFGFWSHDMSGFEGTAPADVYKRWAAFGLLSTHSRLHGSTSYRVPWLFSKPGEENGEESVEVLRTFAKLKCSLMPYLYSAAVETHKTGVPTMRAMLLEFDEIPCEDLDRQYMLGERLLVAPVFSETGDVTYYLPEGEWTHLLSNKVTHGGHWLRENYDFFSLPLFVRENTLLPMGKDCKKTVYDYTEDLTLHLFALKDEAATTVYRADGSLGLTAKATRTGDRVTVTIDGSYKNLTLCLRNVLAIEDLHGATATAGDQGLILSVEGNTVTFHLQ